MKALVLEEYSKFVYKDWPEPEIGESDVLIKVKASRLSYWQGEDEGEVVLN